jgi:hypothetical protein
MTQCNSQLRFGFLQNKQIIGAFDGGQISSDGGLLLVAEADRRVGLSAALCGVLKDDRQSGKVRYELCEMLAQRVYQIACGYEDCNDADSLRADAVLKTVLGRLPQTGDALASQPTLSRFENAISRSELVRMAKVFVEMFIENHSSKKPKRIMVDFDATDDPTHGQQQFAGFHGYYDEHCYLPLIVTAAADAGPQELVAAVLRPGRSHAGRGYLSVLKRLVQRLRQAWPEVKIVLRGDSGFAMPAVYEWCEQNGVEYLIGIAKNSRLLEVAADYLHLARAVYRYTGTKARLIFEDKYKADSWSHQRRVVIKAEVSDKGDNPRFVVTNIGAGDARDLYAQYAKRGDMENRIKELKNDLCIDRTSCHRFVANQFRVLLHAAAFVLLSFIRQHLHGTQLAWAQVGTLRVKLLKLGVLVKETVRRVWLQFACGCPLQDLWPLLLGRIRAGPVLLPG